MASPVMKLGRAPEGLDRGSVGDAHTDDVAEHVWVEEGDALV